MHLHRALRAELLTAEAAYTRLAVDFCFLVLVYHNSLCGADVSADAAAYAKVLFKRGTGT